MARLRGEVRTWTNGKRVRRHYGLGESMAEAVLTTSKLLPEEAASRSEERQTETLVKLRLFEDGSGLFEFDRKLTKQKFSIRFSAEGVPLDVYADFDGVQGTLIADEGIEVEDEPELRVKA